MSPNRLMARAFGKYRLSRRIGVGATAEVFEATRDDGQPIVLKRILPQRASDPKFQELFEREAHIVRALSHPNVVALLDFGEIEHTYYLALEKVDGGDLGMLLENAGSPGPELAALIAREIAAALAYVHAQTGPGGVLVHRDVSPDNVLLSHRGQVKLTDFGIAKHGGDASADGKDPYLAPEREMGNVPAGPPADVYALGAVLREMLGTARSLSVEPLLARALASNPKDRPTAAELVRALDDHLSKLPRPPTREDLGRWVARAIAAEPQDGLDLLAKHLLGETFDRPSTAVFAAAQQASESIEDVTLLVRMKKEPIRVSLPVLVTSMAATALVSVLLTLAISGDADPEPPPPKTIAVSPILLVPEPPPLAAVDQSEKDPSEVSEPPSEARSKSEARAKTPKLSPARGLKGDGIAKKPIPASKNASEISEDLSSEVSDDALSKKADDALGLLLGAVPDEALAAIGSDDLDVAASETSSVGKAQAATERTQDAASESQPKAADDAQPVRPPAKRRPREFGTLSVNSIPWANVFVDGELVGSTPLETTVRAGRHRIVLRSKSGKVIKEFTTEVGAGGHRVHSFDDGTR